MKPLIAHLTGGPGDPSTARVAGCLPRELRYPTFVGGRALLRAERVYRRVGRVRESATVSEATYSFVRETLVHGG